MIGIYLVFFLLGGWFLYTSVLGGEVIVYKTMVQALIMLVVGGGGVVISYRRS